MSSASVAQLAFAAEFALFLVAVAGLACALRPGLLSTIDGARSLLASGFLGLATTSFLRGAQLVTEPGAWFLPGLRMVSVMVLAGGVLRWRGRRSRLVAVLGLGLIVVGTVLARADHGVAADVTRAAAAGSLATALVRSARRSIAARITVNAAALVLAVVVVVAVALSIAVADSVDDQAKDRAAARAANEADVVADQARAGLGPARVVAGVLAGERADALILASSAAAPDATSAATLSQALTRLASPGLLDVEDPLLFVTPSGAAVAAVPAVPADLSASARLALAGDPVVAEAVRERSERQGVSSVDADLFAVAAVPVVVRPTAGTARFTGVVVLARRIDAAYLRVIGSGDEGSVFALAVPRLVVGRTGKELSATELRAAAREVVDGGTRPRRQLGDRFVAAAPVMGGEGRPVAALVVAAPADVADASRVALFRTLFVVALVAAVVALGLAVLVGERIGRGLGRLTEAARRMQHGDLDAEVAVRSDDELGVLGGAFTSMAHSVRSKTEELRATAREEATLRARLEAVITGMSEALLAVDAEGRILEINRAGAQLLDLRRADAIGRPVGTLVRRWRDGGATRPFDPAAFSVGEAVAADLVVGDETVPVEVTVGSLGTPDGDDDGADAEAGMVVVLRDVRQEREVDELKTSILANIGHELRTPLTPIKGYAGMLRDRRLTDDQTRGFAAEIVGGVDQLERVIAQLVTFATIAAGRLDLAVAPVDPVDLGARLEARWQPRTGPLHTCTVVVAEDAPCVVVDPVLIDQAIDELVDNAAKYSPTGGAIRVAVSGVDGSSLGVDPAHADGPEVERTRALVVTVTDEGPGIDPERLDHLVTAFAQGDASTTRHFGGLGLGLASVDRIVRAHGGMLRFTSTVGEGTSASIFLPPGDVGDNGRP